MEETTVYRQYDYDQIEKLVKLTGCTNACNSLTDFEYEELAITGNGNNVNQLNKQLTEETTVYRQYDYDITTKEKLHIHTLIHNIRGSN